MRLSSRWSCGRWTVGSYVRAYRFRYATTTSVSVRRSSAALRCAAALMSLGIRSEVGGVWVSFTSDRPGLTGLSHHRSDGRVVGAGHVAVDVGLREREPGRGGDDRRVLALRVGGASAG